MPDRIGSCDITTDSFFILGSVDLSQVKAALLLLEGVMLTVKSKVNSLGN